MADAVEVPQADRDLEPIHFSESFRRAKRNALFWGAVTILVSLGTAGKEHPVELTSVVHNLSFPQTLLTTFSVAVLIFMMFGYRRAEAALLARHSGFAFARAMHKNADAAAALTADLKRLSQNITMAERLNSEASADARDRLRQLADAVRTIEPPDPQHRSPNPSLIYEESELATLIETEEQRRGSFPFKAFAFDLANKMTQRGYRWLEEETARLRSELERVREERETDIHKAETNVNSAVGIRDSTTEELTDLSSRLHGFADAIGTGERRWFYWHDRAPVWALALAGVSAAVWRLAAPDSLAALMTRLF